MKALKCCRQQINVTKIIEFICYGIENIVGKGENAGKQHFLLFPQCFQTAFSLGTSCKWPLYGKEIIMNNFSTVFLENIDRVQVNCF